MFTDLESFKNNLTNIVRPNRFLVYITLPTSISSNEELMKPETLKFYATTAVIPDRTFSEIEIKYYGMSLKIPAGEVIQDLSITFIMDEEWEVRDFFETWMQYINERETSLKGNIRDLFDGTSIIVTQIGFQNQELASYEFVNVFPKTTEQVELSMDTTDSHSTFQVTFAYSYWVQTVTTKE